MRRLARRVRGLPSLWRRAVAQPFYAFARVLALLPRPLRRVAARALLAVSRERGSGAAARVIALAILGRRSEGVALAEAAVGDESVDTPTRLALIRGAVAVKALPTADRLAREVTGPQAGRPVALLLLADVALRTGRYAEAVDLARRARAVGERGPAIDQIERRAVSEVRVLAPGWRPVLPGGRALVVPQTGRVLHLVTNSLPHRQAGYTVRSQSIGLAQREAGLDPHFATQAGFPGNEGVVGAAREEVVDGVPYHRLAPDFDRTQGPAQVVERTAREAAELVERLRPAVLHAASNFHNAQVALALRDRFGLPVVYEVRGFLEETWASRQGGNPDSRAAEADRYWGARAAETASMLAADAVVTLSETMRQDIIERGADPDAVHVVPNAVDIDRFTPQPRDTALAASLGLRDGETVLGYVSSFTGYEGIRYLIDAAAILRDRGREVRVLLVGEGDERDALEQRARDMGLLEDRTVLFTGRVAHADVLRHYSLIDVFVVPRTADRVSQLVTPLKPYEAMALEKALVVSAVNALTEIVVDGETGLTFRPEDAVALADVVEPLLDDPDRRAALGRNAREWVSANRTWRQNAERYLEIYRRVNAA